MSVGSTLRIGPDVQVDNSVRGDLALFASAAVDDQVEIKLYAPKLPDVETVSILFGDERITLEFCDAASLERLRDLAAEGARQLRAAIEANTQARAVEEKNEEVTTALDRPR